MTDRRGIRIASMALAALLLTATTSSAGYGKGTEWDVHIAAGTQALNRGDYYLAATELDAAMQASSKFQSKDPRLGQTYYEMGLLRSKQGDWADARQYFQRALFIQQQTLPGDSPEVGNTVYGMATACEQTRDYQEAVIHLKRVYEIWSKQYGPTDPKLVEVLASMATYATLDSDLKTAEDCYKQLVNIQERQGKTPRLGASLNLWAATLANAGKYAEAQPIARRAVDLLSTGGDSPTSLDSAIATLRYIEQQTGSKSSYIPASVARAIEAEPATKPADVAPVEPVSPPVVTKKPESAKPVEVAKAPEKKPEARKPVEIAMTPTKAPETQKPAEVTKVPEIKTEPRKPVEVAKAPDQKPDVSKPVEVAKAPEKKPDVSKPVEVAKAPEKKPDVSKPVATDVASKPTDSGSNQPSSGSGSGSAAPSDSIVETKIVMRPPRSSSMTTASDFHPWEARNSTHQSAADEKADQNTNWGKIRYLANGRLISAEQYKAMLLANEAYELIRSEKYLMSIDILQKALTIYPQMASGRSNLGLALSQLGRYDEAIDNLRDAISIDRSRPGAWLNLASSFQMSGQLKEAVATYREFARRFPNEPLTPKALELCKHLNKELLEQEAVRVALGSKATNAADYYAYASHSTKVRWPQDKTTIKVFLAPGANVVGYKPEYAGFFADSFKQWAEASKNRINFEFMKKPDGSDIECMWTDDMSKVSSPAEGGETRLVHDGSKIAHATITVLTEGPTTDSPLSPTQVRAVCLHEIGHALGLVGHSPQPADVMYCSIPPASSKVGISDRDTTTIQKLYSGDTVSWLVNH